MFGHASGRGGSNAQIGETKWLFLTDDLGRTQAGCELFTCFFFRPGQSQLKRLASLQAAYVLASWSNVKMNLLEISMALTFATEFALHAPLNLERRHEKVLLLTSLINRPPQQLYSKSTRTSNHDCSGGRSNYAARQCSTRTSGQGSASCNAYRYDLALPLMCACMYCTSQTATLRLASLDSAEGPFSAPVEYLVEPTGNPRLEDWLYMLVTC